MTQSQRFCVFLFAHRAQILTAYLSITGETADDSIFKRLWRKADSPGSVPPHSCWFQWNCTDQEWTDFVEAIPSGIAGNPNTSLYTAENWIKGEVLDDTTRKDEEHKPDGRVDNR